MKVLIRVLKNPYFLAISITLSFIFLPIGIYIYNFSDGNGFSKSQDIWGTFGDFYGGVLNPIFSYFAFLAVLWTLKSQKEEFEIVRREAKESKRESQIQGFESIFFSYLKNLIDLINSFQLPKELYSTGDPAAVINPGREELFNLIRFAMSDFRENGEIQVKDLLPEGRLKIYFKTVKNILKYIVASEYVNEDKKVFYFEIVKSQFSSTEIEYLRKVIKLTDSALYQYLSHRDFFKDEFNFTSKAN